ncbi:MAG TPA: ACT domain-containing protein [Candidatus Norongarragalinales archaeon]|nr:ACT domain-containing protein [Candidatus Norongarragalinales archaeon]
MSKLELVKIDAKGRVVLPRHFREFLGLKENDTAYAMLDEENFRLYLSPASEKDLVYLELKFDDQTGALARVASVLAKEGVDLVSSESHSVLRGKQAVWRIIAKGKQSPSVLKTRLQKRGLVVSLLRRL